MKYYVHYQKEFALLKKMQKIISTKKKVQLFPGNL